MRTARRTLVATGTVAILAAAGVTAAIAADPAPPPPPKIAFLANGIVPADALAAGPIAGQLGAPIYTTRQESLSDAAANGLDGYDPELVIVLGGPVAISDAVIDQVETATGLTETDTATPAGGIVRAAGGDRFDTAAAVADLLAAYNPAYLPINMQAIDADTLDGKHATDFQPAGDYLAADGKADTAGHADTAGDADTLDGTEGEDVALRMFAVINADGSVRTHHGLQDGSNTRLSAGWYRLYFTRDITDCAVTASSGSRNGALAGSRILSVNKAIDNSTFSPNGVGIRAQRLQGGSFTDEDEHFDVMVIC